jgi:hypothetical protein
MKINTKKFRLEKEGKVDLGNWPSDVVPLYAKLAGALFLLSFVVGTIAMTLVFLFE